MTDSMTITDEKKETLAKFELEHLDAISCWDILQNFISGDKIEGLESQRIDKPRLPKSITFNDDEFYAIASANLEPANFSMLPSGKPRKKAFLHSKRLIFYNILIINSLT